jgi:hypothetical protein
MAKFTKETAPRQGRQPGAKNRMTQKILDNYLSILYQFNRPDKIEDDLNQMSPFNRRKTIEGLTKYILPALTKNDNTNNHSGGIEILVKYVEDTNTNLLT